MKTYLFFDFETTGLFKYDTYPNHDNWFLFPEPLELAWALFEEGGRMLEARSTLIHPRIAETWEEVEATNGIKQDFVNRAGYGKDVALSLFHETLSPDTYLVAHNFDYDRVIMAAAELDYLGFEKACFYPAYCTQKQCAEYTAIPNYRQKSSPNPSEYKWPSLAELHHHCGFGEIHDAHSAIADVLACARCFFFIQQNEPSTFKEPYHMPLT